MLPENTVTQWIASLKQGDEEAARLLWQRFFDQVRNYARQGLGVISRSVQDEEDLALSAFHALCQGARQGRFRQLENRDDLWQLLVMITARKASNARRKQFARRDIVASDVATGSSGGISLDALAAGYASPEFAEALCLESRELLAVLDDKLQAVALLRLQGYTNEEIAKLRGRSVKTVERYLHLIRLHWEECGEAWAPRG